MGCSLPQQPTTAVAVLSLEALLAAAHFGGVESESKLNCQWFDLVFGGGGSSGHFRVVDALTYEEQVADRGMGGGVVLVHHVTKGRDEGRSTFLDRCWVCT